MRDYTRMCYSIAKALKQLFVAYGIVVALSCLVVTRAQAQASSKVNKRHQALLADAEQMMQQRMYPEARQLLEKVLSEDTASTKAQVLLGNIAFLDRQYSKAISLYAKYLRKMGVSSLPDVALRQVLL